MDDYRWSHIPAFGNWDYANDLPITQYFESARQAGLLRYSSSGEGDLYMASDLYGDIDDDLRKPNRTIVPSRKTKATHNSYLYVEQKRQGIACDMTERQPRQQPLPPSPSPPRPPKAVDEDLYKISPGLLQTSPKQKKNLGFFARCLLPTCIL